MPSTYVLLTTGALLKRDWRAVDPDQFVKRGTLPSIRLRGIDAFRQFDKGYASHARQTRFPGARQRGAIS